jgi:hypothetical protein
MAAKKIPKMAAKKTGKMAAKNCEYFSDCHVFFLLGDGDRCDKVEVAGINSTQFS